MTQPTFSTDHDLLKAARGNAATPEQFFEKFERDIEDATFEIVESTKIQQGSDDFVSGDADLGLELTEHAINSSAGVMGSKDELIKHIRKAYQNKAKTDPQTFKKPQFSGLFFVPKAASANLNKRHFAKFGLGVSGLCAIVALAMPLHWALTYSNIEPEFVPDLGLRTGSIEQAEMLKLSEEMMRQLIEPQTPQSSGPQNGSSLNIETLSTSRTSSIVYFHSD